MMRQAVIACPEWVTPPGMTAMSPDLTRRVSPPKVNSKVPSSTIQLLGAEKALFKHIKEHARPPKHGVIFGHPLIHRAPAWQRGKIARAFAAKISIAVKMDRYGHEFVGPKLEADLNRRVEDIRKRYPKPKQNPRAKGGHRKNRHK